MKKPVECESGACRSSETSSDLLTWLMMLLAILLCVLAGVLVGEKSQQANRAANRACSLQLRPQTMLQRGDIEARVSIQPNDANRQLILAWQSDLGAGESSHQLDGDSPSVHVFRLRDQPAAEWEFVASVFQGSKLACQAVGTIQAPGAK